MAFIVHMIICAACLCPRISNAADNAPLYSITFEEPYHTADTGVTVASNELFAPSSLFHTGDTDGVMVRTHTTNQACEFKWTGASSTNSSFNYEQMKMAIPLNTALLIEFDVLFPELSTNFLENYQFTVLMDTDLAGYRIDFNSNGQVGDSTPFQTGVWHRVSIAIDMYYHSYEFSLDDEVKFHGDIFGNEIRQIRLNLWDAFGVGRVVYVDNVSISPRMVASEAAYNIADSYVTIIDSDPHLIYGTSTVNTITVATGVTANLVLSNLYIETTNRYQCAFSTASNATVNLTLAGSNYLMSGRWEAALHVPIGATLNIADGDGSGILTAMGGGQGPGIGGGHLARGGRITINSGNITAIGGFGAAGIGCGDFGLDGGIITIAGGTVVAQGGGMGEGGCGAGIGGGNASAGGIITITGGIVTATGGNPRDRIGCGAGIGGGHTSPGGLITITGGTIFAMRGESRGESDAYDIGTGGSSVMGTNIFIGGSIKTSINSILDNPIASDGNQAFLLVVSNAVDNTNSVSLSLTNMQTGAIYSYTGLGHGNGDSNLYFYLPAGDYPVESEDVLGFYVGADGNSGTMALNPADWTEEQRTIAAVSVNGSSNVLTLIHPLGTHADDFHIEGADKVESNAWNWNIISHSTDENGVITIFTNTPALMLRLQY